MAAEKKVIVYNNQSGIAEKISGLCRGENIQVCVAGSWEELLAQMATGRQQLILLDIMLEDKGWGSNMKLIADLRSHGRMPVIVVSEQASETAKIMALNSGADDFVGADCNPLVLLARIKSQFRRCVQIASMRENIYQIDGLIVNDMERKVTVDGREVKLTPIEYKILKLLVQEKGRVMSIRQIYETIWNMKAVGADNTIAVHVRHIREKIERDPAEPRYLKVVWGTGYKVG